MLRRSRLVSFAAWRPKDYLLYSVYTIPTSGTLPEAGRISHFLLLVSIIRVPSETN